MGNDIRHDVMDKLIEKARSKDIAYYGDLMKEFHIPRGHKKPGIGIGWIVGKISEAEDKDKKPLLSAIVVRSHSGNRICPKGHPGNGFFGIDSKRIPEHLKAIAGSNGSPSKKHLEFISAMQQEVWEYWEKH
jgi:hypothetical protein